MKRPGLLGILILALAVAILIVVPMDTAWKWPTVMLLLIVGFILLFVSGMRRPCTATSGSRSADGGIDGMSYGHTSQVHRGKHQSNDDSPSHSHDGGDGGNGGDGGDGGGGGD